MLHISSNTALLEVLIAPENHDLFRHTMLSTSLSVGKIQVAFAASFVSAPKALSFRVVGRMV